MVSPHNGDTRGGTLPPPSDATGQTLQIETAIFQKKPKMLENEHKELYLSQTWSQNPLIGDYTLGELMTNIL